MIIFSDWLYEEEILETGTDQAMFISDDGSYLLYAQYNETNVRHAYILSVVVCLSICQLVLLYLY